MEMDRSTVSLLTCDIQWIGLFPAHIQTMSSVFTHAFRQKWNKWIQKSHCGNTAMQK